MKTNSFATLLCITLLTLAVSSPFQAQENTGGAPAAEPTSDDDKDNEEDGPRAFWQARMGGGHYLVRLGSIATIAKHEYVSDGAARVVEVTIATNSSIAARFYYLESMSSSSPLAVGKQSLERLEQAVGQVANRAGAGDAIASVIKNYPTTTHAHTVEYRVSDEGHLDSLYRSVHRALESGRGRIWNDPGR